MSAALLQVEDLKVHFKTDEGFISSVNGVSFTVDEGETVAIVGESGCGKSITSLSILGLIPAPGKIYDGKIIFYGNDLTQMKTKELRKLRGKDISMIFQEPMTSLNPVFTIGNQIMEVIILHNQVDKKQALKKAIEMLEIVGIPDAQMVVRRFPHQLSGGMRQRVMIAMALACNPKLLIADEPTTALDVTIQAQILELIKKLKKEFNTGIIMITHDLGVVAEVADRVVVMYAGEVVEEATVFDLFKNPRHPYTRGLLSSIPKIDHVVEELGSIKGSVPNPLQMPVGCKFHPRCPLATDICRKDHPPLEAVSAVHKKRCFHV
ncbi:peptide ABC transporter ATP-binding protein [Bacillus canaveralius]|uniref:Peptide ABC transporter ATP-binding protein n=1 Tax=Bacillus canaveralius TaxID=1403243 RepID=A0A2N5GLQ6_9BACI|nr:ABC transporter ATP-binding protein [Bacillus canaveralius]PLR82529.1 peptide ABC transporter ATP-binding protein [Bacillus canaveralius]PLR95700.1 peptide ABC transporter ATP-binding protein [Bacillus canaveralius]